VARAPICPACNAAMKRGWVLDHMYGGRAVSSWIEGEPEKGMLGGVKLGGRQAIEIETWRCIKCGLLQNYAHP